MDLVKLSCVILLLLTCLTSCISIFLSRMLTVHQDKAMIHLDESTEASTADVNSLNYGVILTLVFGGASLVLIGFDGLFFKKPLHILVNIIFGGGLLVCSIFVLQNTMRVDNQLSQAGQESEMDTDYPFVKGVLYSCGLVGAVTAGTLIMVNGFRFLVHLKHKKRPGFKPFRDGAQRFGQHNKEQRMNGYGKRSRVDQPRGDRGTYQRRRSGMGRSPGGRDRGHRKSGLPLKKKSSKAKQA